MNKDFLKQVFVGKKKLLGMSEVKRVNVPTYDELSVVNLWPDMQSDATFMLFFPDSFPKGRLPDRTYFFDIMNTVTEEFTQALIKHAAEQRNTAGLQAKAEEVIEISEEWWAKLQEVPFKSCKSLPMTNVS